MMDARRKGAAGKQTSKPKLVIVDTEPEPAEKKGCC